MSDIPTPYREVDLFMQGASGIGQLSQASRQAQQRKRPVHPLLQKMIFRLAEDPSFTPQQAAAELQKELDSLAQTTSPAAPSLAATQPVAVPPPATVSPEQRGPAPLQGPIHIPPTPEMQAWIERLVQNSEALDAGSPIEVTVAGPGRAPQAQPGQSTPFSTLAGQARSAASGQLAGQTSAPSLGTAPAPQTAGPTLAGPPARQQAPQPRQAAPQYPDLTGEDLEQFAQMTPFIGTTQKPGIEREKVAAKQQLQREQQFFKQDLEAFKQTNANARVASKLDAAMKMAQGRLDMDGQKEANKTMRLILSLEAMYARHRESIEAMRERKQGDWKMQVLAINRMYAADAARLQGQIAGSINLLADPALQDMLRDTLYEAAARSSEFERVEREIGQERDSPAVGSFNTSPTAAPEAALAERVVVEKKPTPKKAGDTPKTKKKVSPKVKSLLDELD